MNKFKVGDPVIVKNRYKGKIFGICESEEVTNNYAVIYKEIRKMRTGVFHEFQLQLNEIEVGDTVRDIEGAKGLVEHITKKTLALTEEKMALIDMCEMLATNTNYKIECLSNLELVEKGDE